MKNKYLIIFLIVLLLVIAGASLYLYQKNNQTNSAKILPVPSLNAETPNSLITTSDYALPTANYKTGQTKKHFGQYITPQNSPVQPEKFTGYHTGVDIEVPQDNAEVPVYSISNGLTRFVGNVSGYGGVIIIQYTINGEMVTALYGHIRLSSATVKAGDQVAKGEQLAVLGSPYLTETGGERKHLHFSLHRGVAFDYVGYVQKVSELSAWLDPNNIIN